MPDEADPPIGGLPSPRESERLIGHSTSIEPLVRAWRAGRMHHAVLLSGRRGIGKATFAYQFAAMAIARENDMDAARRSPAHRQIAQGAAQQFRRLARQVTSDGKLKKEITVEDVRTLAPFLRQRTEGDGWRVVLIDAVDDLNRSSANALLKILEEPGDRTLFLLVSHGTADLLDTIRSRCLLSRWKPLAEVELREVLGRSDLSDAQIDRVVPRADGSVRRAIDLATSDGYEALEQIERILAKPRLPAGDVQRLVDSASGRGSDAVFDLVRSALPTALLSSARKADLPGAKRLVDACGAITSETALREEYGVDRAVSLKAAIYEAHNAIWGHGVGR